MVNVRIIDRPAFDIIGKKTHIDGPNSEQFGQFWEQCRATGLFGRLQQIKQQSGQIAGQQTNAGMLGVSCVEKDPADREFDYMIAIEAPAGDFSGEGLERRRVPAASWAIFECHGPVPDALIASEMFAFGQWLPNSGFQHAFAPEMEVYPAAEDPNYCEFWLPIIST